MNSLTPTQHSDESSSEDFIKFANTPINVFKNQIFLLTDDIPTYKFEIIFPTYHRHTITRDNYSDEELVPLLKTYLNPSVVNDITTDERTLGGLQRVYPINFRNYKIRLAREVVTDVTNESAQETEIIKEHRRAHRNAKENICQLMKATPIPEYLGEIVHLDLFYINHKIILTHIDKLSKYAQAKIVESRSVEDIKEPLGELITSFGFPQQIVVDNEKSLAATSIKFMLED